MDTYISVEDDYIMFRSEPLTSKSNDLNKIVDYDPVKLKNEIINGFNLIDDDPFLPHIWCRKVYTFYLNNLYHYAIISLYTHDVGFQSLIRIKENKYTDWDILFLRELKRCISEIPKLTLSIGVIRAGSINSRSYIEYPLSGSFRLSFVLNYLRYGLKSNKCLYRVVIQEGSSVAFHLSQKQIIFSCGSFNNTTPLYYQYFDKENFFGIKYTDDNPYLSYDEPEVDENGNEIYVEDKNELFWCEKRDQLEYYKDVEIYWKNTTYSEN